MILSKKKKLKTRKNLLCTLIIRAHIVRERVSSGRCVYCVKFLKRVTVAELPAAAVVVDQDRYKKNWRRAYIYTHTEIILLFPRVFNFIFCSHTELYYILKKYNIKSSAFLAYIPCAFKTCSKSLSLLWEMGRILCEPYKYINITSSGLYIRLNGQIVLI